jgi:Holliday junction resolvase-like predicted endonuclease
VGIKKQKKMSQLARWYLQEKKINDTDARFDVVAILMLPSGNDIRLIRNAFDFISF